MPNSRDILLKLPDFSWSPSGDGTRTIGTAEGIAIDLLVGRVEVAAIFPPDRADIAALNGQRLTVILAVCRPDWEAAPTWLANQMRSAAQRPYYEDQSLIRRVRFTWDRKASRATLTIRTDDEP